MISVQPIERTYIEPISELESSTIGIGDRQLYQHLGSPEDGRNCVALSKLIRRQTSGVGQCHAPNKPITAMTKGPSCLVGRTFGPSAKTT